LVTTVTPMSSTRPVAVGLDTLVHRANNAARLHQLWSPGPRRGLLHCDGARRVRPTHETPEKALDYVFPLLISALCGGVHLHLVGTESNRLAHECRRSAPLRMVLNLPSEGHHVGAPAGPSPGRKRRPCLECPQVAPVRFAATLSTQCSDGDHPSGFDSAPDLTRRPAIRRRCRAAGHPAAPPQRLQRCLPQPPHCPVWLHAPPAACCL
jgi:hypothetical protein